jgi:integrase
MDNDAPFPATPDLPPPSATLKKLLQGEILPPAMRPLVEGPVSRAVAEAADYAKAALSAATRRAYLADWTDFAAWCRAGGAEPLPASPIVVAGYLASLAKTLGRSGLKRRLAAIAHFHRAAGHIWLPGHPAIRATLRGIFQEHGVAARPAAALTSEEIKALLATCTSNLAGIRDTALFLVGFAGALRRSELVAIDREHLRFTDAGLSITLPRSKTDQDGEGAQLGIPRFGNRDTCPVRALESWLRRAGIAFGPVFRKVSAAGKLESRLTADGVRKILRRRAALAGLVIHPSERLSPHGLRAGFITEAYLRGALDEQVMQHVRHTDINTTRGYRRRAKLLVESPAKLLDL